MSSKPQDFEARQLPLPTPLHTLSPGISALLYDPFSTALALRHSDTSFSLYSSFSPLSLPSFPPADSLVPSPTSSAAFLHLRASASTLFVTSSPLLRAAPSTLLRFYLLLGRRFVKIGVLSNHRDLEFDRSKFGVVFRVNHGVSVKLSGGINVFSLYSASNAKIWVFAVRMVGDEGGGRDVLKLMKCAVIDCCFPVLEIRILFGFVVTGEENGVRFFPLQPLVKGNHKKEKKSGKRINSKHGPVNAVDAAMTEKSEKHSDSVKLKCAKLRQDSKDMGAFFVTLKDKDGDRSILRKTTRMPIKAISIQALSSDYFVVLDSDGDVHLLCLSNSSQGVDSSCIVKTLPKTMNVVKLAVFNDVSAETKNIWMSDEFHSVHLMAVSGMETSFETADNKEPNEKLLQTSVTQAIFTSEKIQDIIPLAANSLLVLGQGNMFAYAIM